MKVLEEYIEQFKDVRPNRSKGNTSPHKICMLFAVMDLVADGVIQWNVFYFNDTLKNRFAWHFERLRKSGDSLNAVNPFFYLRSSQFWHHHLRDGREDEYEKINTPSESSIHATIEHVSVDAELFEFMKDPVAAVQLRAALALNLDSHEEGFQLWARAIGKSEKTVKNYTGALKNSISNWLSDSGVTKQNILTIQDYFELSRIINRATGVEAFVEHNKRGGQMYMAALKLYQAYLDQLTDAQSQHDVALIEQDDTIPETTKATLVQARRGQGKFRERLIAQWKGCCVTGYSNLSLLMASHIKPWAKSSHQERLDPYNGLLLTPNLDKAFDLHFITFNDKGRILISDELGEYSSLGIHTDMTVRLVQSHLPFMSHHRDAFYER